MSQKHRITKPQEDESSYDSGSQQNQQYEYQNDDSQQENLDEQESNNMSDELENQQMKIKQKLKQISFGDLLRLKQLRDGQNSKKNSQIKRDRSKKTLPSKQRADKSAPKEIKIMRRPLKPKLKQIFTNKNEKSIDPRFQQYAGHYNPQLATKTYSFISDIQKGQAQYLKKQIKNKRMRQQDREVLLKNYNKLTNQMKRFQHNEIEKKVKAEFKNKTFKPKRRQIKQYVQKAKLDAADYQQRAKILKKKQKKIHKNRVIQRKKFLNSVQ